MTRAARPIIKRRDCAQVHLPLLIPFAVLHLEHDFLRYPVRHIQPGQFVAPQARTIEEHQDSRVTDTPRLGIVGAHPQQRVEFTGRDRPAGKRLPDTPLTRLMRWYSSAVRYSRFHASRATPRNAACVRLMVLGANSCATKRCRIATTCVERNAFHGTAHQTR